MRPPVPTALLAASLCLPLTVCAQQAPPHRAAPPSALERCQTLRRHGQLANAQTCYEALTKNSAAYLRAEGFWGIRDYETAKNQFEIAIKDDPRNAMYHERFGRMFLERFNPVEAGNLFNAALEIDKTYAPAYVGLAKIIAGGFGAKAIEYAGKAIESDPTLVEPHEMLAYLELEDNDSAKAIAEADKAIAMSPEALDALAIRATIELLDDKPGKEWIDRILAVNPVYGEAYATAGHFFVINRRYEEGIAAYRKALDLNPELWEARAQLGVNLMRLGGEKEARQQLEDCFNNHYRSLETVNSLRLLDTYKDYNTYTTPTTVLRLAKKEADLLYPYFQAEMDRAMATYEKKYGLKLAKPVQVEVYPNHDDFAVRTMGMPGLGALGVTFGSVVAMDSPSGRPPGTFNWGSTLWHELSHVYVLNATHHRVPRWFTEGLAVYEETAASPDWGDRLDPEAIQAIEKKKLLPVAELDRGFVRPSYPSQVIVSYFQAGKICSYISEKWGYGKLLEMMHAFADLKPTPEVIQEKLGMPPKEFDTQFLAWLESQTKNTVEHMEEWRKTRKQMEGDLEAGNYDDAIREGERVRDYYPDYVESGSIYQSLADAHQAKGDKVSARRELERYGAIGGRSPALLKRLASLEQEAGDNQAAITALERLNYIYPEDEELHRRLGDLLLARKELPGAIREYRAVLANKPMDPAASHYQLAKALHLTGQDDGARDEVLQSLEVAPGYKPAQQLLLELSK